MNYQMPPIVGACKFRVAIRDGADADRQPTVVLVPYPISKTFKRPFVTALPADANLPSDPQWTEIADCLSAGRIASIDCASLDDCYDLFEKLLAAVGRLPRGEAAR